MEQVITTYGGGEVFYYVFNGIAALFTSDGGVINNMTRLALTVGAFWVMTQTFVRNELFTKAQWLMWVLAATTLLTVPKTTVFIHDPIQNVRYKVDNVPLALGTMAATTSSIGKAITEKLEQVFTLPGMLDGKTYQPYHKTGTVFASALMSQVGKFRIVDPDFNANMERFVNQCVVIPAMIGHKYTLKELHKSDNIWKLVSENASPVLGFMYKDGRGSGSIVTCKTGVQKLQALWKDQINEAIKIYGGRVQDVPLSDAEFKTRLSSSYSLLSNAADIAKSAEELLRQEMMISAIEQGSNNKLSEMGGASNYASTKALMQQRSTYAIAGEIAAKTLPLFKNVVEAITYALFLFVAVFALLPQGWKTLGTYFGILVWTQLWAPLYAVLNLIMTVCGQHQTMSYLGGEGLTLLNSSAVISANTDMKTLAAWLSISIPFLSYGILKQGAGAFVGMAQSLGSAMQAASSGVAAETVSGNVSLGNVSVGTQAFNNKTGFQINTSPSYDASHFRHMDTSGTEVTTHGSGHQSVHDQAMPQMASEFWVEQNTSLTHQRAYEESQRNTEQLSMQASNAMSHAAEASRSALLQADKTFSASSDYSSQTNGSQNKAIHEALDAVSSVSTNKHFTGERAMGGHAGAGVGGNVGMGHASVGGDLSVRAAHGYDMGAGRNANLQQNSGTTIEKGLQEAIHKAEATGNTDLANTAKSALHSFRHAQDLTQQYQASLEKTQQLSDSLTHSQSHTSTERKNVTKEYLDYVQAESGKTAQQAMRLIDEGGEAHRQYYAGFLNEHRDYSPIQPDFAQKENQMNASFAHNSGKAEAQAQQGFGQIESKGMGQVNAIERENDLALKPRVPDQGEFQQQIEKSIANTQTQVEAYGQKIELKAQDLSQKVSAQENNYLMGDLGRLTVGEEPKVAVPTFSNDTSTQKAAPAPQHASGENSDYGLFKGTAPREAFAPNPTTLQAQGPAPDERLFASQPPSPVQAEPQEKLVSNSNSGPVIQERIVEMQSGGNDPFQSLSNSTSALNTSTPHHRMPQDFNDSGSSKPSANAKLEDRFPSSSSQRRS